MKNDVIAFFESQSRELASRANRVRQLIGDTHWYTDGASKESLLLDAILLRLPAGMEARRGFVLSDDLSHSSKEQDCVIIDRHASAPIFQAADFHLVNPQGVCGLVSVKTRLAKKEFVDATGGLATALKLIAASPSAGNPFTAVFFFDNDHGPADDTIADWIRETRAVGDWPVKKVDVLDGPQVLGPLFIFSLNTRCVRIDSVEGRDRLRFYRLPNIAAAVFLHLLETATFDHRKAAPVRAWNVLEDSALATLTSTIDL